MYSVICDEFHQHNHLISLTFFSTCTIFSDNVALENNSSSEDNLFLFRYEEFSHQKFRMSGNESVRMNTFIQRQASAYETKATDLPLHIKRPHSIFHSKYFPFIEFSWGMIQLHWALQPASSLAHNI